MARVFYSNTYAAQTATFQSPTYDCTDHDWVVVAVEGTENSGTANWTIRVQFNPALDGTGTWDDNVHYYADGGTGALKDVALDTEATLQASGSKFLRVPVCGPAVRIEYGIGGTGNWDFSDYIALR